MTLTIEASSTFIDVKGLSNPKRGTRLLFLHNRTRRNRVHAATKEKALSFRDVCCGQHQAWSFAHSIFFNLWRRYAVLLLLAIGVFRNAVVAQIKLTAKAGLEFSYIELDGLGLTDAKRGYFQTISGLGFGRHTTFQLGGRFGPDQLNEAGIGIALGSVDFRRSSDYVATPRVSRKSIYMIRWSESSAPVVFGYGSQIYWYNMSFNRSEYDPLDYSDRVELTSRWRSIGLDWRLFLRGSFGTTKANEILLYFALSGENIQLDEAAIDDKPMDVLDAQESWVLGYRLGLSYSYTFGGVNKDQGYPLY